MTPFVHRMIQRRPTRRPKSDATAKPSPGTDTPTESTERPDLATRIRAALEA